MTLASAPAPFTAPLLDRHGAAGVQGDLVRMRDEARRARLRQRNLVFLRWLAVGGQSAAVLFVHFGLGFDTPLAACLAVIGASAWLNVVLTLVKPMQRLLSDTEAALQIGFDVLQLTVLLGLTGGMANPFALLLIGPVAVGAAALPPKHALGLGVLALGCPAALTQWREPLPWSTADGPQLPAMYEIGLWAATTTGMVFTAGYAWAASRQAQQMELALLATQAVLAREQRMSALGALAAAAAHELGTPLATIQVVAKEMMRALPAHDPNHEDAQLLLSQAERCRDILKRLSREPDSTDGVVMQSALQQLLEEVAEPYRGLGAEVTTGVHAKDDSPEPVVARSPESIHALSAFVENAIDFAEANVVVVGHYDAEQVIIEVADDGPGFAPQVLAKLGEPYVTSRPNAEGSRTGHVGMGLGFFIAKTLLERTGAEVKFRNGRRGGAAVCVIWPRDALRAPDAFGGTGVEPQA